ncbi:MAG: hypothetical protein IJX99_07395 [Clostridia bacterium]|nr:hypothetical protein [Clostridia bacterium]
MNIKSECLRKELTKNFNDLKENTFKMITKLKLSKLDFCNKETDMIIEDLLLFENLESVTLYKFTITNDDIEILKRLKKLQSITFDFCEILVDTISFSPMLESIVFNVCPNMTLKKIDGIEVREISVIGSSKQNEVLEVSELLKKNKLINLSLNNYRLNNLNEILKVSPNLMRLNIDGSNAKESEINMIKENIILSHNKEYLKFE